MRHFCNPVPQGARRVSAGCQGNARRAPGGEPPNSPGESASNCVMSARLAVASAAYDAGSLNGRLVVHSITAPMTVSVAPSWRSSWASWPSWPVPASLSGRLGGTDERQLLAKHKVQVLSAQGRARSCFQRASFGTHRPLRHGGLQSRGSRLPSVPSTAAPCRGHRRHSHADLESAAEPSALLGLSDTPRPQWDAGDL